MIRLLVLGAVAIVLTGCGGGYSKWQGPLVDMNGVDMNRYNADLSACIQGKRDATFVGNGQFISICMENRGYKVLERYG